MVPDDLVGSTVSSSLVVVVVTTAGSAGALDAVAGAEAPELTLPVVTSLLSLDVMFEDLAGAAALQSLFPADLDGSSVLVAALL